VSSCYKWLLATHGVGIFAYDAARVGPLEPATLGWHSVERRGGKAAPLDVPLRPDAARLEAGNPSLLGLLVLDNALEVLDGLDAKAVLGHAVELGGELIEGLRRLGLPVITPAAPGERAGNVCFLAEDGVALAARLAERGVLVWGGDGRVRISAHVHDSHDDVARCLAELASLESRR